MIEADEEALPAEDGQIAAQLLESAHAIHDALARERTAAQERAQAEADRVKHQTRAAQLLVALQLGPNFPSILSQVMR